MRYNMFVVLGIRIRISLVGHYFACYTLTDVFEKEVLLIGKA